uniref:Uncharacterized protein n=1 Tax=virus sp. ctah610 TaxID=2826807 RepID=A0A8S5R6Q8_9VIRU|nr:MAG TPA: hypothetical protein [virus sp. ctah610]
MKESKKSRKEPASGRGKGIPGFLEKMDKEKKSIERIKMASEMSL